MGNSTSQVAVKQTRTELSIQPAPTQIPVNDTVKNTLLMLSQLEGEINDLILQSNIKIIPQNPNPQSVADFDLALRGDKILKQSASAVSSPSDPDIASKLLYVRKHIHRDIFTTYTSNHFISSDPPPLHEIYLANRDTDYSYDHVYYSRPPVPSKSDLNLSSLKPLNSSQNHQNPPQVKSRYRTKPKKPSVSFSDNISSQSQEVQSSIPTIIQPNAIRPNESQLPQDLHLYDGSQSIISVLSTPTNSDPNPFDSQFSRMALLKDSSSSQNNLVRRSISSLKDLPSSKFNSDSKKSIAIPPLDPHYNSSYIYSPIVTQTESFHADIVSLASEKDNVVDLSSFPQLKHYATSDFYNDSVKNGLKLQVRNGYVYLFFIFPLYNYYFIIVSLNYF